MNGQQATLKNEPKELQIITNSNDSPLLSDQKQGNKFVLTPDYIQQSKLTCSNNA